MQLKTERKGNKTYFSQSLLGADRLDDHSVADAGQQSESVETESRGYPDGQITSAHASVVSGVLGLVESRVIRSFIQKIMAVLEQSCAYYMKRGSAGRID